MNKLLLRRLFCAALCVLAALTLTGCVGGIDALSHKDAVTLPPAAAAHAAPTGDTNQEIAQTVLLYVPNAAGTRLTAQTERIVISAARHPAEATLRQLFAFPGSDSAQRLCQDVNLQLSPVNPVEISGGTATVNLGASALTLSHADFYVVCQAIANTLTQWGDIRYVNVLVSSTQPGLDVGASVPMGCFTQNLNDSIDALTAAAETQTAAAADRRFSLAATLYYPTYSGRGILAETQSVSFGSRLKPQLIETLLEAMSQAPQQLSNVPAMPDLTGYLSEAPAVQEIAVTGGQRAVLRFQQGFNDALIGAGIPRSVMLAAITYTITGFVPGINGITVYIGEELVSSVVPGGVYDGAGETIRFSGDIMRRSDFSRFLLANCALYFSDGSGHLTAVQRPIPYYETRSARYLLGCLMQGPQAVDGAYESHAVLPEDLGDADLLGVGLDGNVMLLNFSQHFAAAASNLDAEAERLLIYAIVNTLCELPAVRSVSLFIAGAQPETLSGGLYLPGEFMKNGSIVRE
ncbi:MAG: GerMN domain-containing protein [Clostridia bacterium]|nr:GerMN domain-containing protein [Clostridia bacterium]